MSEYSGMVEDIRILPCLACLGNEELLNISEISRMQDLEKNSRLFEATEPVKSLFVVKKGSIKLSKISSKGRELIMKTLGPGDYFCCAPLYAGGKYFVSATALEDSTLVVIPADRFKKMLWGGMNDMGLRVVMGLCKRIKYLSGFIENLSFKDVEQRVLETLVRLAEERETEDNFVHLALTHQDIASMVGTVREVVSRVIAKLRREGIVVESTSKGCTVDKTELSRFSQGQRSHPFLACDRELSPE